MTRRFRGWALAALAVFSVMSSTSVKAAPLTYVATLNGASESPPNASTGIGTAVVEIDAVAHTMRVEVAFLGLIGNVTAAHIHATTSTAFVGTSGVATSTPTFPSFPSGVRSGTYDRMFDMTLPTSYRAGFITSSGGTTALAETALFNAIAQGKAYFNIHTTSFSGGEIRGFFVPAAVPEIDPASGGSALSLVAGVLAMIERRRRTNVVA